MNTVKRIMNTVNPTRSATAEPPAANGTAPASVMAPPASKPTLPSTESVGGPAEATRSTGDPGMPAPATAAGGPAPRWRGVRRSRIGALWVGVIAAAAVLILLLIFILQNSRSVKISYLGMHGHLSLAVAMLLSAIAGILLVAIPGTARILQLRRGVRRGQPARR